MAEVRRTVSGSIAERLHPHSYYRPVPHAPDAMSTAILPDFADPGWHWRFPPEIRRETVVDLVLTEVFDPVTLWSDFVLLAAPNPYGPEMAPRVLLRGRRSAESGFAVSLDTLFTVILGDLACRMKRS